MCVNEFTGLTFNCDGEDPRGCLTTGEQVLKRLGFEKTLKESLATQGMVAVGTYLMTYFFLANQKPDFEKMTSPDEASGVQTSTRGGAVQEKGEVKKRKWAKGSAGSKMTAHSNYLQSLGCDGRKTGLTVRGVTPCVGKP